MHRGARRSLLPGRRLRSLQRGPSGRRREGLRQRSQRGRWFTAPEGPGRDSQAPPGDGRPRHRLRRGRGGVRRTDHPAGLVRAAARLGASRLALHAPAHRAQGHRGEDRADRSAATQPRPRDRRRRRQDQRPGPPALPGVHLARPPLGSRLQVPARGGPHAPARHPRPGGAHRPSHPLRRHGVRAGRRIQRLARHLAQRPGGRPQGRPHRRPRCPAQGRRRDPRDRRTRHGCAQRLRAALRHALRVPLLRHPPRPGEGRRR